MSAFWDDDERGLSYMKHSNVGDDHQYIPVFRSMKEYYDAEKELLYCNMSDGEEWDDPNAWDAWSDDEAYGQTETDGTGQGIDEESGGDESESSSVVEDDPLHEFKNVYYI